MSVTAGRLNVLLPDTAGALMVILPEVSPATTIELKIVLLLLLLDLD